MVGDLQEGAEHAALAAVRAAAAQAAQHARASSRDARSSSVVVHRRRPSPFARLPPRRLACRSVVRCCGRSAGRPAASGHSVPRDRSSKRSAPATGAASTSLHRDAVAEPVGLAARCADQRVAVLLVAEIFVADRARRDEAVGAGVVELHEQAGAGDAAICGPRRSRRRGRRGNARSGGRRSRARPSWRAARRPRCAAEISPSVRSVLGRRAAPPSPSLQRADQRRDARSGRHSGGSAR